MTARLRADGRAGRREHQRGGALVLSCFVAAMALFLALAAARLGSGAVGEARADTAADAAALAAADMLALGRSSADAREAATDTAASNGAELVSCDCAGADATVVVAIDTGGGLTSSGRIEARARAEVLDTR